MSYINNKHWAYAKSNNDFIFIETYSGYFNCLPDPEGKCFILSHSSADSEVGIGVLEALAVSRTIDPRMDPEFFNISGRVAVQYNEWVADLMVKFNYKNKRSLFRGMRSCSIVAVDGSLVMRPSHHEKLEAWSAKGITEKDHVVVSSDSSLDEVGAALRLAFSRCT